MTFTKHCYVPNFILFTSTESSFTLNEELRAVKCFLHHQPVTPSPIHLLSLIFLLFVTHWHSEPTVFHPVGPFGMKRVMTLPYCFPLDAFQRNRNTHSPLSYHQHHQACQLPIKRGPATVSRQIDPGNSTASGYA